MWLVFIFAFLILGIFFSKISFELNKVNFKDKEFYYEIKISFKIFYFIKVFNKKIKRKYLLDEIINKIKQPKKIDYTIIKYLNIKIEKINFLINLGLVDINLTNLVIVLISSIIPILINGKVKKINYKILPIYNKLIFSYNGKIVLSVKLIDLAKLFFKNIKNKITHNKTNNYSVKESY